MLCIDYFRRGFCGALRFVRTHIKAILCVCVAVALVACGWFACKHFGANKVTEVKTVEVPVEVPIEVPVEVKGETVIRYVEKQTEDEADVQVDNPAPKISVSYNGEKTELDGVAGETQKFEKGTLKVEQSTEAVLDVTPIVERENQIAVANQKLQDEAEKQEAIQEEKHKAHKHGQKTLLGGIGLGIVAGLLL